MNQTENQIGSIKLVFAHHIKFRENQSYSMDTAVSERINGHDELCTTVGSFQNIV
jgi:hypothetical protein